MTTTIDGVTFEHAGVGYAHVRYRILENKNNLSDDEIAEIVDGGVPHFGYRREGNLIIIHTD